MWRQQHGDNSLRMAVLGLQHGDNGSVRMLSEWYFVFSMEYHCGDSSMEGQCWNVIIFVTVLPPEINSFIFSIFLLRGGSIIFVLVHFQKEMLFFLIGIMVFLNGMML